MTTPDDAKAKAAAAYNAAADLFDDPANSFWDRFGRRTVERIGLQSGDHVLDACCGSGASVIPAAVKVGPSGFVLGVDLAEDLLALARAKARARGLDNVEFRVGDVLDSNVTGSQFDAVVCVFGIFFIPDMVGAVHTLWEAVRPGGKLAITTWGPRAFEPASTAFWDSIRELRPDLHKGFNPWDRISKPRALLEVLRAGGIERAEVVPEPGTHPIPTPEAWWTLLLGSGYRGTIEQLDPQDRERVHQASLGYVLATGIDAVETSVVYAVAEKE